MPDRNARLKARSGLEFGRTFQRTVLTLEAAERPPAGTHLAKQVLGRLQYKPEVEQYLAVLESIGSISSRTAQRRLD